MENNEWEKNSANDSVGKSWQNAMDPNSTYIINGYDFSKVKKSEYVVKFEHANKTEWLTKKTSNHWTKAVESINHWFKNTFVLYYKMFCSNVKTLFEKKRCNEADVEQLRHDLDMANARISMLEYFNKNLEAHANHAWETLAAYRKLEREAIEEQAKNKKAAKKRPSSKKKRKG